MRRTVYHGGTSNESLPQTCKEGSGSVVKQEHPDDFGLIISLQPIQGYSQVSAVVRSAVSFIGGGCRENTRKSSEHTCRLSFAPAYTGGGTGEVATGYNSDRLVMGVRIIPNNHRQIIQSTRHECETFVELTEI